MRSQQRHISKFREMLHQCNSASFLENICRKAKKNAEGPANLPRLASKALISTAQQILLTPKVRNIQYGWDKLSPAKGKDLELLIKAAFLQKATEWKRAIQ